MYIICWNTWNNTQGDILPFKKIKIKQFDETKEKNKNHRHQNRIN